MANLVKSKTPESEKNLWATTWECFADAKALYGREFKCDVAALPATAKCTNIIVPPDYTFTDGDDLLGYSIIGVDVEAVVQRFVTGRPMRFEVAEGPAMLNGIVADCDEGTGACTRLERICRYSTPA